jgi:hypothetical protein
MVVYIASYSYDCEGTYIIGVFSTSELAWNACDKCDYGDARGVQEWELDSEAHHET